jgi:hypothetical protein
MNLEDMQFPVYRRYKNGRSYFKIINPKRFEEVRVVGVQRVISLIDAKQFPEINFIRDLILNYREMADEISAADFEQFKAGS